MSKFGYGLQENGASDGEENISYRHNSRIHLPMVGVAKGRNPIHPRMRSELPLFGESYAAPN